MEIFKGGIVDFWNQRNVLVTGCTGFLGWHLTAELIEKKSKCNRIDPRL